MRHSSLMFFALALSACASFGNEITVADGGATDAERIDAETFDATTGSDGSTAEDTAVETDSSTTDMTVADASGDASGSIDTGIPDASTPDASTPDASTPDASTPDAASGSCLTNADCSGWRSSRTSDCGTVICLASGVCGFDPGTAVSCAPGYTCSYGSSPRCVTREITPSDSL